MSVLVLNWFVAQRQKEAQLLHDIHVAKIRAGWQKEGLKEGDMRTRKDGLVHQCHLPIYQPPQITVSRVIGLTYYD